MKIWILGADGLLGRQLVRLCKERAIPLIATGRQVDVTDVGALRQLVQRERPSHAINCAAYTDVDRAESEGQYAFAVNALGPQNLGHIGRESGLRVLHISTDYVFDGGKRLPYSEEEICAPLNVYGKSKRAGEELLLEALPTACVVRTSWLFGEGGKNFLSRVLSLLQTQDKLQVDDEQVNRPTSVRELAKGLLKLIDCSGIWHFANRGEATRFQVARYVMQQAKEKGLPLRCQELAPTRVQAEAPRPLFSVLATHKVEQLLGPLLSWQEVIL